MHAELEAADLWWKNAVVYCLDVETYADGDGDGVGDFVGLSRRLDHLAALGVTCLWLLPFMPSGGGDDGYDPTDYYAVDPRLGSMGDFVNFRRAAAERGMRVVVDLPLNHTSEHHPWFRAARSSRDDPKREWYVWSDEPVPEAELVMLPGEQDGNWTFDDGTGQWWFHRFHSFQPNLNLANPEVRLELMKVIGYWLELGVAGFRFDAAQYAIETVGPNGPPRESHHEWLRELRAFVDRRAGDRVLIGEVNLPPKQAAEYLDDGDGPELHLLFNYEQNASLMAGLATGDLRPLREHLSDMPAVAHDAGWLNFARLHDELTLECLDDDTAERVLDVLAPDESHRLYGRGLRRRLPPLLHGDRPCLELAYALTFALPGNPMLLYGEEVAMGDNLDLPGRMAVRTTMHWDAGPNGGFTASTDPVRPPATAPFGPEVANVADQRLDPGSFLSWMARMVAARRSTRAIGLGPVELLDAGHDDVLAHRMRWGDEAVVCAHSFSAEARTVDLDALLGDGRHAALVFGSDEAHEPAGREHDELRGWGYRWWRVACPPG